MADDAKATSVAQITHEGRVRRRMGHRPVTGIARASRAANPVSKPATAAAATCTAAAGHARQ